MGSIVEIDIGASKLVSISPHQLGVVACCLTERKVIDVAAVKEADFIVPTLNNGIKSSV